MPCFINSVPSLNWGLFKISQPKYHCVDFVDTLSTRTIANYTCGPYGQFLNENGTLYRMAESRCLWNKTWSPPELDPCKAICLHAHSLTAPSLTKHKSIMTSLFQGDSVQPTTSPSEAFWPRWHIRRCFWPGTVMYCVQLYCTQYNVHICRCWNVLCSLWWLGAHILKICCRGTP